MFELDLALLASDGGDSCDDSGDVPHDELGLNCDNDDAEGEAVFEVVDPLLNLKALEIPLLLSPPLSTFWGLAVLLKP